MEEKHIIEFWKEYRFLSNFYPVEFVWDNIVWPSSEHAYQAAKTLDRRQRLIMSKLKSPSEAKQKGSWVYLREDWCDDVKIGVMYQIVKAKFRQNPDLKEKLLATGNAHLEEGNTWNDRFWGVCPPGSGNGRNELGKILMRVREELK